MRREKTMKLEEKLRLCKLYDAYSNMLPKSQQDILAETLFRDFTGSEIAVNLGISRQAVKDAVNKGCAKLNMLEDKLHLVEKIDALEKEIAKLKRGN